MHINNNFECKWTKNSNVNVNECKWTKDSNKQTEGNRMDKKTQDPSICCVQETHFRPKHTCRLKVRGWRNIYHVNGCQKKARVAILILALNQRLLTRDQERHYVTIKGTIQ